MIIYTIGHSNATMDHFNEMSIARRLNFMFAPNASAPHTSPIPVDLKLPIRSAPALTTCAAETKLTCILILIIIK